MVRDRRLQMNIQFLVDLLKICLMQTKILKPKIIDYRFSIYIIYSITNVKKSCFNNKETVLNLPYFDARFNDLREVILHLII